jgi:Predicted choline kinase involved in LPS biosynthesis
LPARRLLRAHAGRIEGWLTELDRLGAHAGRGEWVVTHGEPHPGNLIRTAAGLRLVDWDTVRLGPPERDLWLVTDDPELLGAYTRATGRPIDPGALELHRLRWRLADIAEVVDTLRRPHGDGADAAAALRHLTGYLS